MLAIRFARPSFLPRSMRRWERPWFNGRASNSEAKRTLSMSFARRVLAKSATEDDKEEMEANVKKMKANAIERQSKISEHEEVVRPDSATCTLAEDVNVTDDRGIGVRNREECLPDKYRDWDKIDGIDI